ncbi:hypothetical protein D3C73_1125780 [compost metagenome]
MDTQAQAHLSFGKAEQGLLGAGEGAAAECRADGSRELIRLAPQTNHGVEVQPGFGSSTHDFENHEVPGNAAALLDLLGGGAGDVVCDQHVLRRDALSIQAFAGHAEVHDIPGVVAVAEHDAGSGVGGLGHRVGLLGRG